jgi:NADH:ubiquinone oxidoreductase subunit 5 (subunit L)/multisubunit Na+/H+ antiporter MnhA subunit
MSAETVSGTGLEVPSFALLIILLPMLAFPVILLLGRLFNGKDWWRGTLKEGGLIALPVMAASLIVSLAVIRRFLGETSASATSTVMHWVNFAWQDAATGEIQLFSMDFGFYVDHTTVMLLFVASFLCLLINIFSIGYMNTDPVNDNRNHRFYAEFVLFCSGMLGMVLSDSFLWLFIFWELMGLCSYLLIGFYYERPSAAYAAKKAFLTTRVGDVFLVIGLAMLWNLFQPHAVGGDALAYSVVFDGANLQAIADAGKSGALQLALGFMFIGAVGKSAQFPLHVWLPDAMEGPTPVSALIHAATMVNAGLYLVARMFPIFGAEAMHGAFTDLAFLIALVGGITACMAALIAFVQMDLKKVLAYSTMSQLAYIFTGLGAALWLANSLDWHHDDAAHTIVVVAFGAALFHLFNHAMAKGMLFMASGSVIHEMHHAHHDVHHHHDHDEHHDDHHDEDHFDAQSMANMGGLASKLPITATAMLVGSASIIGLPLIGGFWSKEGIIANTWRVALEDPRFFLPAILVLVTAGMTGFYMSRMWFMTFAGKPKSEVAAHVHEQTPWIPIPLLVLIPMSLSAIVFASLEATHYLGDTGSHLGEMGLLDGFLYEMEHAFANHDPFFLVLTYIAIGLSLVVGPMAAMALYGGQLADGEVAKPWLKPFVSLSARVNKRHRFDNAALAEGSLATALQERLYFDAWYDAACEKLVAGFSNLAAVFDRRVVDGAIKGIESGSQSTSRQVRSLTTGSARDYIMMAALGTLLIALVLWGVA